MAFKSLINFNFKFINDYQKLRIINRFKSVAIVEDNKKVSLELGDADQIKTLEKLKNSTISVDQPNYLAHTSGVPLEHVFNRRARIYRPAKNAMQSGTYDTKIWRVDFENQPRWENPLMGWTSTGDPQSNLHLSFSTKEDAIAYCQRQGFNYVIDESQERRKIKKSYADNFSWNKRTRVESK